MEEEFLQDSRLLNEPGVQGGPSRTGPAKVQVPVSPAKGDDSTVAEGRIGGDTAAVVVPIEDEPGDPAPSDKDANKGAPAFVLGRIVRRSPAPASSEVDCGD